MTTNKHSTSSSANASADGESLPVNTAATCEGKFVKLEGSQLTMINLEGQDRFFTLAHDARLTCDGSACKPEDLQAGRRVRLTTSRDDRTTAVRVEAIKWDGGFAAPTA